MQEISVDQLKAFESLVDVPEEQLQWLIRVGKCRQLMAGDILFTTGDTFDTTIIILTGKVRLFLQQSLQLMELASVERGSIVGYLPFSRAKISSVHGKCVHDTLILEIEAEEIKNAVFMYFELTEALVHTMTSRVRFITTQQQQDEKMSAGLAHELNNPAAAIVRSASFLSGRLDTLPDLFSQIAGLQLSGYLLEQFQSTWLTVKSRTQKPYLSMLDKSAQEDVLTTWLEYHQIDDYSLAESLVDGGFLLEDLERLYQLLPTNAIIPVFKWISHQLMTTKITKEIEAAAGRISALVGAVKSFSHMDRGKDKQWIDIHTGLENTLTILNYKLKKGNIAVIRSFEPTLPAIQALAGELNQVWANIIDNAIDAMAVHGKGTLRIITEQDINNVVVTICDDGPGIPAEISTLIFDPFFTTKEIGKGTGLGLDVARRIINQHKGSIQLKSIPGNTAFIICLPIIES